MDRKLISCVGYSLRIAQRQGKQSTVEHLWHALHSLTHDDEHPLKRPLCLYAALGLDIGLTSTASSTQVNAAHSAMVDTDVTPGILFQDFCSCSDTDHVAKIRGQQRSDQASQTEARKGWSQWMNWMPLPRGSQKTLRTDCSELLLSRYVLRGLFDAHGRTSRGLPWSASSSPVPSLCPTDFWIWFKTALLWASAVGSWNWLTLQRLPWWLCPTYLHNVCLGKFDTYFHSCLIVPMVNNSFV